MERIKYYSSNDFSFSEEFNRALSLIKNIKEKECNINDILEFYNILKFLNNDIVKSHSNEIDKNWQESKKIMQQLVNKFCLKINKDNIMTILDEVELNYIDDFFEVFSKYKIYTRIDDDVFTKIINRRATDINSILEVKDLVKCYDQVIRKTLIEKKNSAELLLSEFEVRNNANYKHKFFPKSLTNEDKEQIIINYINEEKSNLNYLRIVADIRSTSELSVSDSTKLLAKHKASAIEDEIFGQDSGLKMTTTIRFVEKLGQPVKYKCNGCNWDFAYDLSWIKENINDYSTLLNNFIYLFQYVDNQMRWTMVNKRKDMSIFESELFMHSKHDYLLSIAFGKLDSFSDLQMALYYTQLQKLEVRLEDVISWFFTTYLQKEFKINNFYINMPSSSSNYLEKCRTILPEIDYCLKQFNCYVNKGFIDQELLQISSNHTFFKEIKSLLPNKYVYSSGKKCDELLFYFFSDQSMLKHSKKCNKSYSSFYDLIMHENLKKQDFYRIDQKTLECLLEEKYLTLDENGFIRFRNITQIKILRDLNNNEVVCYWKLSKIQRNEVNNLVENGILEFEESLFSRTECSYLNYCLNKSEFNNSLDLRNMYSHGTQPSGDEKIHYANYIKFLKIFILIIIKINDELCTKEDKINIEKDCN